jgi:hypothetical protein
MTSVVRLPDHSPGSKGVVLDEASSWGSHTYVCLGGEWKFCGHSTLYLSIVCEPNVAVAGKNWRCLLYAITVRGIVGTEQWYGYRISP